MADDSYDGGDGEQELIIAANNILSLGQADTVTRIKEHYWKLGEIIKIAIDRKYTQRLSMKGWIATNLRCSHTHAYDCLNSHKERHNFDDAYRWYQGLNNGWQPTKMTGPRFALEIIKAWRGRVQSETDKLTEKTRKKQTHAKDALDAAKRWESRYVRLREEHRKLAEFAEREPIVLQAIEHEIAAEGASSPLPIQPGLTPAPDQEAETVANPADESEPVDGSPANSDPSEITGPGDLQPMPSEAAKQRKTRRRRIEGAQVATTIETNKEPPSGSSLDWNLSDSLGQMADRPAATGLTNQKADVEASHVN